MTDLAAALPTVPPAGYRLLRAWQRALDLAAHTHHLARTLPSAEYPTLADDIRRAGAAVPAHIAAGNLSCDRSEHRRALLSAQTALARVETLALLAERLALAPAADVAALLATSADTLRLVRGLTRVVGTGSDGHPAARCSQPAHQPARATRARRTARPAEPVT